MAEEVPEITEDAFEGVDVSNVTLYVPMTAYEQYASHPVWGMFFIKPVYISMGEIEDAITPIDKNPGNKIDVYDLNGRKFNNSQLKKGIHIINGKKVLF